MAVLLAGVLPEFARAQEIVVQAADTAAAESEYYRLITLPLPNKVQAEAGALCFLPDGRLALAVYFPYYKMGQSATGILADTSGGKFGPFAGQMFVGDLTHSMEMRVTLEKIKGRYQGACLGFRRGFASGNLATEWAGDGSMFVFGTNRGWGSVGPKPFALQRLVWTGRTPFEVRDIRARPDGFELTFTQRVDPRSAGAPASYALNTFTYVYHSDYGSPEVDATAPTVRSATVAPDGLGARLVVDGLVEGHVHEMHFAGVRSAAGKGLLHDTAYYTLNAIPTE